MIVMLMLMLMMRIQIQTVEHFKSYITQTFRIKAGLIEQGKEY
jgi:hypothetical protein